MNRLLTIARWLCGDHALGLVFEPLIADWSRELHDASDCSRVSQSRIVIAGGLAFGLALSRCAMRRALSIPPGRALARGAVVFTVATVVTIAAQAVIRYLQTRDGALYYDEPLDLLLFRVAVPLALPLAIPIAMLPLMMQLRRSERVHGWHGVQCIIAGSVLAFVTAGWVAPLANRPILDAEMERLHQRSIANDEAGRFSYPGTALRQRRPTTLEDRARRRVEFRNSVSQTFPEMTRTLRTDPTPLGQSITRVLAWHSILRAPILALALGLMGWALGGLGRTRVIHAALWWALVWFAVMVFEGRLAYLGNDLTFRRLPYWIPTVLFVIGATALQIASARRTARRV